jgi:peptide-methionine (S)-S-oxide reductase
MNRLALRLFFVLGLSALPLAAETSPPQLAQATFGAGCFWCVEAIYQQLPGVVRVVSGYAGGRERNPTYAAVSSGRTSHAEVIQITYDPTLTTYEALLETFWRTHDPTDPRGVWPDFGPHYRSIILVHDDTQLAAARASRDAIQGRHDRPIITEITRLTRFYPAEDYHQDYARRNPTDRYVRNIVLPKLRKFGLELPAAESSQSAERTRAQEKP